MRALGIGMIALSLLTAADRAASDGSGREVGKTVTGQVLVKPADLKWTEGPAALPPGSKMAVLEGDHSVPNALFTIRLRLPANYRIMPHTHPADEHVTVISGAFWMGMGGKFEPSKLTELPAGAFAVMPVGHQHFAMTRTETIVQVHAVGPWAINYVNPADDPRSKPKK